MPSDAGRRSIASAFLEVLLKIMFYSYLLFKLDQDGNKQVSLPEVVMWLRKNKQREGFCLSTT
jgi:hypothetical protein